jgi:AcrR family transcriptional regulator
LLEFTRTNTVSNLEAPHQSGEPPLPRGPQAIVAGALAADQRQRLIAALTRAVAENGFGTTTVGQIVKLAQVRRNVFYEQFADKQACFAAAYEIAQERLLGVLTFRCYTRLGPAERIDAALGAGLNLLAAEPGLARLIAVEAPAAGGAIADRHHDWLDRYSRMLRLAVVGSPDVAEPRPALEPAIAGAVVSRVKQLVLAGEARKLPSLRLELTQLVLSFFGSPEPLVAPGQRDGVEPAQPQSPERSSVLEPA